MPCIRCVYELLLEKMSRLVGVRYNSVNEVMLDVPQPSAMVAGSSGPLQRVLEPWWRKSWPAAESVVRARLEQYMSVNRALVSNVESSKEIA